LTGILLYPAEGDEFAVPFHKVFGLNKYFDERGWLLCVERWGGDLDRDHARCLFAALIVDDTTEVGTRADATFSHSTAANVPHDKATCR
jgi:hypothetical protein